MSEIDETKASLINLLVGLYVKKTYFKITRSRTGTFFSDKDEVADHIQVKLAEILDAPQAHRLIQDLLKSSRAIIQAGMLQVGFDPANANHLEFCQALTDPSNQGKIGELRDLMKPASDKALDEALSHFAQFSPVTVQPDTTPESSSDETVFDDPPAGTSFSHADSGYRPLGRLSLDRNILSSGDRLIEKATAGKFPTLESVFNKLIEADRTAIAKPAIVLTGHDVPAAGSFPRGQSRQITAAELFVDALRHPTDAQNLDFKVTVFDWAGAHPRVPSIDPSYRFAVDDLRLILWAMEKGYNSTLTGPPGCGKTTLTREIAARLRRPWYRVPMHGEMGKREMLGGFKQLSTQHGPETRWFDGLLTQAIQQPSVIDVDEIDRADPDLQYIAHQVYEGQGITILEDEGRFVPPHPNVALLATANTKGRTDALNRYQMITEMSEATRDRFTVWIDVDYLPPDEEAAILVDRGIIDSPAAATNILKVANLMRAAYKRGELGTTCSFRQLEATVDLASFYGNDCEAVRRILYARAPTTVDARTISELAHQVYGPVWNPPAPF